MRPFEDIPVLDEDMNTLDLQDIKSNGVVRGPLLVQLVAMKPTTKNKNNGGCHRNVTWRDEKGKLTEIFLCGNPYHLPESQEFHDIF